MYTFNTEIIISRLHLIILIIFNCRLTSNYMIYEMIYQKVQFYDIGRNIKLIYHDN